LWPNWILYVYDGVSPGQLAPAQESNTSPLDNPNKSSTYKYSSSNWTSQYGFSDIESTVSGGSGDWAFETMTVGSATIKNQLFAIEYKGDLAMGIIGLAYPGLETHIDSSVPLEGNYSNFPQSLAEQGVIKSPAFSIWMDQEGYNGTLLFGGTDTKKYNSTLTPNAMVMDHGAPYFTSLAITLNDMKLNGFEKISKRSSLSKKATASAIVTLDCGSSGSTVPPAMANPIIEALDGVYNETENANVVDCKYMQTTATIDFIFPNVTMTVPLSNMIGLYGDNFCLLELTAQKDASQGYLLGVNFLRGVYSYFDLEKNQVSFATRDFDATTSNIVATGNAMATAKLSFGLSQVSIILASFLVGFGLF
jgi:hypothetical protein